MSSQKGMSLRSRKKGGNQDLQPTLNAVQEHEDQVPVVPAQQHSYAVQVQSCW